MQEHEESAEWRQALIERHLGYARGIVLQFCRERGTPPVERRELVAAAMVGLCEAAQRYSPDHNSAFTTFAYLRIRGAMIDFLRMVGEPTRQAAHVRRSVAPHRRHELRFIQASSGSRPRHRTSTSLQCNELGITVHYASSGRVRDCSSIGGFSPEDVALERNSQRLLTQYVNELPPLERQVIELHYFEERSLEQVRQIIGRGSKSWLSRIRARAVEQLRERFLSDVSPTDVSEERWAKCA